MKKHEDIFSEIEDFSEDVIDKCKSKERSVLKKINAACRQTKCCFSDLKKAKYKRDFSMGFCMPGGKKHEISCSCSMPALKAVCIMTVIALSLCAVLAIHIRRISDILKGN